MGGFDLDMNARAGAAVIEMAAGDTTVGLPVFARILCKPLRAILFGITGSSAFATIAWILNQARACTLIKTRVLPLSWEAGAFRM